MGGLEECNRNTPEFSLSGMTLKGKVIECHDGDTCKIALPVLDTFYKFTCRLYGIDTPEMKPYKLNLDRDDEIIKAKQARTELLKMICDSRHSK